MTLPDESRDVYWKSQEIWDWLVHPLQSGVELVSNSNCGVVAQNLLILLLINSIAKFGLCKSFHW